MLEELQRLQKKQGDLKPLKAETVRAGVVQAEQPSTNAGEESKDPVVAMATLQRDDLAAVAECKAGTDEWDAVAHAMYPLFPEGPSAVGPTFD